MDYAVRCGALRWQASAWRCSGAVQRFTLASECLALQRWVTAINNR